MATQDFPSRPQTAPADSFAFLQWLDALGNRQSIDLQQELTSVASGDEIGIFDVSETGQVKFKKITRANFLAGQINALLDISGASGGQIKFPATQNPSADANTLDDYEEGTWTPTDTSGAGLSFTVNIAKYIKIGSNVNFWINLQYPATASGANTSISLPFTLGGATFGQNVGGCWATPPADVVVLAAQGTSNLLLFNDGTAAQKTNVQMTLATVFVGGAYGV